MAKNKQQREAEARAKTTKEVQPAAVVVAEQPKQEAVAPATPAPAPAAAAQPVPANKVTATLDKLKEGWTAKGVDLSKMTVRQDGKFTLVVVAEGWPTVQIGPTGGITVKELKSYAKAFDAAMDGLALYQKQQAREQKKAAAPAQPVKPEAKVVAETEESLAQNLGQPVEVKKETTTAKKAKQAEAIEQSLSA